MRPFIVVTGANEGYFALASDLLDSLRQSPTEIPFGVLDVGLAPAQRDSLQARGAVVASAKWDLGGPARCPQGALAMFSRPFLPNYFPDFETLVYLDADSWVQMPEAMAELAQESTKADVAVVPDLHVAFPHLYSPTSSLRTYLRATYETVAGKPDTLIDRVTLNSGVFAAHRESIFWRSWQYVLTTKTEERLRKVGDDPDYQLSLARPEEFFLEANSFNYAFHTGLYGIRPVASTYNWVCEFAMPLYDPSSGRLTEPVAPYEPIRVVHLCQAGRKAEFLFDRQGKRHPVSPRWKGVPKRSS